MKKFLLAVVVAASAVYANAQTGTLVPIYLGGTTNANDSVSSGLAQFSAGPADWVAGEVTEGSGNIYYSIEGSSASYYVNGVSGGQYNGSGANVAFGYNGTAAGYFSLRIQPKNADTRMKVGFVTTDNKAFGQEVDISSATLNQWNVINVPFADFNLQDAGGNDIGGAPTAGELAMVGQVNVVLLVQSWCDVTATAGCTATPDPTDGDAGTISRFAELWFDDIYFSQNSLSTLPITSTLKSASLIADSKVYPNPSNNNTSVELDLKSVSNVKITLSDLMGKEILVIADENTASVKKDFNVSNLNSGLYTVNYFINGSPAKSELLMVK